MPFVLTVLLALLSAAQPVSAADARVIAADFVQTRRLAGMDMAVRISGSMVCERGGRLRWQVDSPVRSVTVIEPDKLTHFDRETGKLAVVPKTAFPWLKILRDSLDDWLSGDPKRLEGKFDTAASSPDTLVLTPRDAEILRLYRRAEIRFAPDGKTVRSVRLEESSGDVLSIEFLRVRPDPVLPANLWRMPPE